MVYTGQQLLSTSSNLCCCLGKHQSHHHLLTSYLSSLLTQCVQTVNPAVQGHWVNVKTINDSSLVSCLVPSFLHLASKTSQMCEHCCILLQPAEYIHPNRRFQETYTSPVISALLHQHLNTRFLSRCVKHACVDFTCRGLR